MKALILTASAGNGHNSASKRLKEKILEKQPYSEVEIVDTYKEYASFLKEWTQTKGYLFVCNHAVGLYNYFFKKTETTNFSNPDKNHVNKNSYPLMFGILNKIINFKPDLIFSTYIYNSVALANLKRVFNIPAKVASLTLDYGISPYWECISKQTDYMFLTNESMINPFIERGFSKDNLFVTGIPVSNKFENLLDKTECKKALNLDPNTFTLLVMKAGFFGISEKDLIKNFEKVETKIQIIIINGKNKNSKNKLDKLIKKHNLKHKILNLGFISNIENYFACCDCILGKAGGLTTTESINALIPSLIINNLPQQEIYNKQFLIDNDCAISVDKSNIYKHLNNLLNNKDILNKMKNNLNNIRITGSIDKIFEIISKIPTADYSKFITKSPKKHTLIKMVDKQRKLQVKINKQKTPN